MSVRVIGMVFEAGPQDLAQHSVMMALADNADDFGVAWPGQELLARKSRQSVRNVRRVLDELVREGWLVERKRRHGEHRRGSVYELNLARLQQPDTVSGRARKVAANASGYATSPDTVSSQQRLPAGETQNAPADRTMTHGDRTITPARPDMALADLLLSERDANQNRQGTTTEPKDSPLPPTRGGGIACSGDGAAYAGGPLRGEGESTDAARESSGEGASEGEAMRGQPGDAVDREALAELDEVNAMRARRTPPLAPLTWAAWASLRIPATATGTDTPRRARRRMRRAAWNGRQA